MPELSRRDFIKGVGLVPLAAALPAPVLAKALADTSNSYRFFTPHEAAVVIEATARIIPGPTDDPTEADERVLKGLAQTEERKPDEDVDVEFRRVS